ncbi:CHAT domain-containing protein [[Limnothrix rosea] IAM M-220]|uniref:CHAT domain-containing protein n=1 Tax=[Limnothrix rosea] IAM M-220 TaxID=454133 RepID=UPI00095DE148|nr:CHAT domain-containing protein [[Limnothrix rosea] IAM M-220]OKH12356.1 CHAT domain-containing protein [[Limnothrix rosea] IAM M-220]
MRKALGQCFLGSLAIALGLTTTIPSFAQTTSDAVVAMEQSFEREFETYFGRDLATVTQSPAEMGATLARMGAETDTKPAVIWAMSREDHLHLVLVTSTGEPIVRDLYDVPQEKLEAIASRFTQSLTNPRRPFDQETARQLYQWLLEPFELDFLRPEEIDTILFCLGDGLRGIPLAALHDGDRFLIEKYALTRIPAFNLIAHEYGDIQRGNILAMGASKFEELSPLPAVPLELATIVKQGRSPLPTQTPRQKLSILNDDFTGVDLQALLSNRQFDIVHFATHADFLAGRPSESYIQFYDQKVTLEDIPKFNWHQANVDLLVLSACRTAVGDGEAELGFAGLALQLGINSAIATLWNISDAGTLTLMGDFYQELSLQNTKAEALRQAQLTLLKGDVNFDGDRLLLARGSIVPIPASLSDQIPTAEELKHPYYWAGFSMISSPW